MSVIIAEELRAGYILGDPDNDQYLYMPGSEIGVDDPMCIFEDKDFKTDVHLKEAVEIAKKLTALAGKSYSIRSAMGRYTGSLDGLTTKLIRTVEY